MTRRQLLRMQWEVGCNGLPTPLEMEIMTEYGYGLQKIFDEDGRFYYIFIPMVTRSKHQK